jgi:hypothetical protein
MGEIMKSIVDNAAGPTGAVGILIAKSPSTSAEWLIFLSIILVICQLVHWAYRFFMGIKRKK